jgi:nucleotide-binding universal stress UspA family protein
VHALALSRAMGGTLGVLHVADTFPGGRTESDARSEVDEFLAEAGAGGIQTRVVSGDPKDEIVRAAAESPTDYVVMGTHGRGGFERFVLGSVTEHVLRKAPCPVLAVPPGDRHAAPDGTFPSVVCAVDFSDASRRALDHAERLVAPGGRLLLVHAITWPYGAKPGLPPQIELLRQSLESDAADQLRTLSEGRRADLRIGSHVGSDKAYADILRHARAVSADLIVMGLHSHGTSDLALLGSTTRRVLHDAPCPVLTVG